MAGSTSEEKSEEINLCNLNLRVYADLCLLIHKRLYLNADIYCTCITIFFVKPYVPAKSSVRLTVGGVLLLKI
jgi:hypothetical protein